MLAHEKGPQDRGQVVNYEIKCNFLMYGNCIKFIVHYFRANKHNNKEIDFHFPRAIKISKRDKMSTYKYGFMCGCSLRSRKFLINNLLGIIVSWLELN